MKVIYFTESLYPHVDGVSRTLARLFETLQRKGIDFEIYAPFQPGAEVSWAGHVHPVPYVRFPPYPDYRISLPLTRRIREGLKGGGPDLVHLVSPTPLAYRAQRIARGLGLPVVASFHTHFVSYFRYYGIGRLERLGWKALRAFYRGCDRVYAPSESLRAELESHGVERVAIWSRGIDLNLFSPARRDRAALPQDDTSASAEVPVLLFVSRLVKEKDLGDLIGVEAILRARSVRFRLVIVGDGPSRAELEKALPGAHFAGHLAGEELARCYASADVFVFPSTTETFGNVVLEALASGLPAVVVDRGGPADLIRSGENGFVARSNDSSDIAGYVERILRDEALRRRLATGARESARSRDWDSVNGALVDSYATVIATSGSGAEIGT
jgi:phosphatidylinositol alpha 1,6-mannosyltransferase